MTPDYRPASFAPGLSSILTFLFFFLFLFVSTDILCLPSATFFVSWVRCQFLLIFFCPPKKTPRISSEEHYSSAIWVDYAALLFYIQSVDESYSFHQRQFSWFNFHSGVLEILNYLIPLVIDTIGHIPVRTYSQSSPGPIAWGGGYSWKGRWAYFFPNTHAFLIP